MYFISNATNSDLIFVKQLAHKIWYPTYGSILTKNQIDYMLQKFYDLDYLEHQMLVEKHRFLLLNDLETNDKVGFAAFNLLANEPAVKLQKLYISSQLQGKNLGKMLLNAVEQAANELNAQTLCLNVNRHNKAKFFYEKQGFSILKEEDIDIGNGFMMNDFVMSKQLV